MAQKTYYVASGADGNFAALVDGVAQTAASRTDGWTVAKSASPLSSEFDAGTKQSGTFSSNSTTPKPASFLTGTTANAFKTPAPLTGTFDNVLAWSFSFRVRAGTASSQAGRIRMRVFKSVNASGASATELTTSTQVGSTSSALSTSADQTSGVIWNPGASITLNNEYLFFVIAWEITTASGSNSGDVLIRTGSSGPAGSVLLTPDFVASAPTNTPISMPVTMTLTPALSKLQKLSKVHAATMALTSALSKRQKLSKVLAAATTLLPALKFEKNLPPVSDYQGRWDASDASSMTVVTGHITSWADKGSLGLAMIGDASTGPTLDGVINSISVPNFDGISYYMHTIHAQTIPNQTVFVVTKPNVAGQNAGIWGGDRYGSEIGLVGGIPRIVFTGSAEVLRANTPLAAGTSHILAMVYDNVTAKLHVDGKEFSVSYPNGFAGQQSTWSLIAQTWSGYFNGAVAEVIWFERTLSPAEVAAMESYLKTKWGIFLPKLETLTDTFDTTVDFTKWDNSGAGATWDSVGKRVALPCNGGGETAASWLGQNFATPGHNYDLTGSYLMAKIVLPPNTNGGEIDFNVIVSDGTDGLCLNISAVDGGPSGGISPYNKIDNAWSDPLAQTPYDPVAMAFWRIRESGGTIYFETSPDGRIWNLLFSEAAPFAITEVFCDFECYNQGGTNTGTGYVDYVNAVPALNTPITLSATTTLTPALANTKNFKRAVSGTAVLTPALVKKLLLNRPLVTPITLTPAMTTGKKFFRTLAASSTVAPTMNRFLAGGRLFATSATLTPTISRKLQAFRNLNVGGTGNVVSDNFNRADGGLGPNWATNAEGNNPLISGNKVTTVAISSATWVGNTFGNDQFAQVDNMTNFPDASTVSGLILRSQLSGATCYHGRYFSNAGSPVFQIYKRTSPGALTQIGSNVTAPACVPTDVLRFEISGNTLTLLFNGVVQMTLTDSSIPSGGAPGIRLNGSGTVDNFQGGDLVSGSVFTPSMVRNFNTNRAFAANVVLTPAMAKNFFHPSGSTPISLNATMTMAPTMLTQKQYFRALTVTAVFAPTMSKRLLALRLLAVSTLISPLLTARVAAARLLAVPVTISASMSRLVKGSRRFDATTTIIPNMSLGNARNQFLNRPISFAVGMGRSMTMKLAAPVNFITGSQRKTSKQMPVASTLTPTMGKLSRLSRRFDSVTQLQASLDVASGKKINLSAAISFTVRMSAGRINRIALSVSTNFTALMGFVRFLKRKTEQTLFSAAVPEAQLLAAQDPNAQADLDGVTEEETAVLLSASYENPELASAGEETPGLRSVS